MLGRVTIFSLRKKRTDSLKVITSADAQFSAQNQVKGKREKKGIASVRRSLNENFPKIFV